jgi:hypothetical protein
LAGRALSITALLAIQILSVSSQHNVGCHHEPKRVVTYKRDVDKHGNDCEQGHNKRNDMDAENVEHCNGRGHASSGKNFAQVKFSSFVKNYKTKWMTDKIFSQQGCLKVSNPTFSDGLRFSSANHSACGAEFRQKFSFAVRDVKRSRDYGRRVRFIDILGFLAG